ncbi:uncharacterized protein ISCGN_027120 [Ixodes scapularis]
MLLYEGYSYTCSREDSETSYWICRNRKGCKAKITTDKMISRITRRTGEHSHPGDPTTINLLKVRNTMKEKAVEGTQGPQQILLDAAASVGEHTASQMPPTSTLRRTIRKQRQQSCNPYSVPATREDVVIPGEYTVSLKQESFVAHDSGFGDRNRILVFATQRNLDCLSRSKAWFMDGTFKVTPSIFFQVYTVHGMYKDAVIPLVYALLPNKTEETYQRLFTVLSSLLTQPAVELVYCDFESAAIIATGNIFPQARVQGCFFHLCQAVYRKLCKLGFQTRYGTDEDFAVLVRMLPALAFLPPAEVPDAFEDLVALFSTDAMPLALYFEDTYIGRRRRNGLLSAMFPTSVWSVHASVLEGLPRTNNAAEAWHRSFQTNINCSRPNLWSFLGCLQREQSLQEMKIAQLDAGQPPSGMAAKYRVLNERISRILYDHDAARPLSTLRCIARNVRL